VVTTGPSREMLNDPALIESYLGGSQPEIAAL
jgi:hypothetical protein